MPSILFVCMANRFRSPVAAAVFQSELAKSHLPGPWLVSSAGTWAVPGQPVLPQVQQAALRLGLNLAEHRSASLTGKHLAENDLVLVMQAGQREALLCEFPGYAASIHLLSQAAEGHKYDIPDAVGSIQDVEELVLELDTLVRGGSRSICALAARLHDENSKSRVP